MESSELRPSFALLARRYAIVVALVLLDLWSKAGVFAWLEGGEVDLLRDDHGHLRHHVLGESVGWFTFMLSENPGAAFGQFGDFPHALIGLRVVAVLFLIVLIFRAKRHNGWFVSALLLVLAGALGNLYDNLFLPTDGVHPYGKVRDFIDVYFGRWDWHFPTFNVADSCITVGAAILLIGSLGKEQESEEATAEDSEAAGASERGAA